MHSVSSNAVARLGVEVTGWSMGTGYAFVGNVFKIAKIVIICGRFSGSSNTGAEIMTGLPVNKGSEVQFVPATMSDYSTTGNTSGIIGIEANSGILKKHTGILDGKFFGVCIAYITE